MEGVLMVTQESIIFEPLPMRREILIPVDVNQYKVVMSSGESLVVEAGTAYEAFERSGLPEAQKIIRSANIKSIIVSKEAFVQERIIQKEVLEPKDVREEVLMNLKRRRTPVISAKEMGRLMNILKADIPPPTITSEQADAPPIEAKGEPLIAHESAPIEAASDIPADTDMSDAAKEGGFEEIIPSAMPSKPASLARPAPVSDMPATSEYTSEQELPPSKELSQDDIDKLLNS